MHADSLSCRSPWKPKTLAARKDLEVVVHIALAARGKLIPKADLQQSRDSSVRLRIPSPDSWLLSPAFSPYLPDTAPPTPSSQSGDWRPSPVQYRHGRIHRTRSDPASADLAHIVRCLAMVRGRLVRAGRYATDRKSTRLNSSHR